LSSVEIKVLKNTFPEGAAQLRAAISAAFAAESGPLLSDMQQRTPVDTGELRDSESAEHTDTTLTLRATAGHAIYVHQGTSRMGARPFMRDAVNAGMPRLTEAIIREATSALG
jgi:HK97 gp10 family phage protein